MSQLIDAVGLTVWYLAANDHKGGQGVRRPLITAVNEWGETALHFACRSGHYELVEELLARRPDLIDAVTRNKRTVLHCAASTYRARTILVSQLLLARRPTLIDAVDSQGGLALHVAIEFCQVEIADLLLAMRPEHIHHVDRSGNTILHHAVLHNLRDERLLAKLWRMNLAASRVKNLDGRTPYELAVWHERCESLDLLRWEVSFDATRKARARKCVDDYTLLLMFDKQCELLFVLLNEDVLGVFYEYCGLHRSHSPYPPFGTRAGPTKRTTFWGEKK